MRKLMHISYEEFAENLTELLDKVRAEETSIVVEFAGGKNVLIKRDVPGRGGARKRQSKGSGSSSASISTSNAGSGSSAGKEPPANQSPDRSNVSSVGAVYDIDPNSITPG